MSIVSILEKIDHVIIEPYYINDWVQKSGDSNALAFELPQSCTKPSI